MSLANYDKLLDIYNSAPTKKDAVQRCELALGMSEGTVYARLQQAKNYGVPVKNFKKKNEWALTEHEIEKLKLKYAHVYEN